MAKKMKPVVPLFAIWLDGRRLTQRAYPIDEAIALLGACTRRWERENDGLMSQIGVRGLDGSLYLCAPLLIRRDDGASLLEIDWAIARETIARRRRDWSGVTAREDRHADKTVAGWSFGVEWRVVPKPRLVRAMEPDEDALDSSGLFE